jgi:hypothetical protein
MKAEDHSADVSAVGGTPEHVLSDWLVVEVPDTETAMAVVEQLEASTARDVKLELVQGKVRVRWR